MPNGHDDSCVVLLIINGSMFHTNPKPKIDPATKTQKEKCRRSRLSVHTGIGSDTEYIISILFLLTPYNLTAEQSSQAQPASDSAGSE